MYVLKLRSRQHRPIFNYTSTRLHTLVMTIIRIVDKKKSITELKHVSTNLEHDQPVYV